MFSWFRKSPKTPVYIFVPKEDITAYELALVVKALVPALGRFKLGAEVPSQLLRHLRELK